MHLYGFIYIYSSKAASENGGGSSRTGGTTERGGERVASGGVTVDFKYVDDTPACMLVKELSGPLNT